MDEPLYYVDGDVIPAEEATVPVNDRGFKYGDAAFETVRVYGGEPFAWDRHVDRLRHTCELLAFDPGYGEAELRAALDETLEENGLTEAYVRLSLTRGTHAGKLTPPSDATPRLVIIVSELPRGGHEGTSVWDGPASVDVVDTIRVPDESIPAAAKTHNYLNGILAREETDADETIMLDRRGNVTEGATSNVFICRDGTLKTPSLDGPVLPGITREVVFEIADRLEISVESETLSVSDLRRADEAFLTNSTWEVRPIARIGDVEMGPTPTTDDVMDAFDAAVESACY